MKISKLFHWLYGFLMLLPVFGVLFKVGYVMFNDNAFESYSGEYKFQYVDVVTFNELQVGNNYVGSINFSNFSTDKLVALNSNLYSEINNSSYANNISITFDNLEINTDSTIHYNSGFSSSSIINTIKLINFYVVGGGFGYLWASMPDSSNYNTLNNNQMICLFNDSDYVGYIYIKDLPIVNIQGSIISINNNYSSFNPYFSNLSQYISNVDNTLSSVFYASLQEINNTEFFSWAKDSFLVQPIMYIGNLFGITNPHPIFTFMSYWLAISIIWLVFDLVMYVPLLVHRWIDKGVIE